MRGFDAPLCSLLCFPLITKHIDFIYNNGSEFSDSHLEILSDFKRAIHQEGLSKDCKGLYKGSDWLKYHMLILFCAILPYNLSTLFTAVPLIPFEMPNKQIKSQTTEEQNSWPAYDLFSNAVSEPL